MATLLASFAVFLVAGLGIGLGLLFGRPPAKSCGRDCACAACPKRRTS